MISSARNKRAYHVFYWSQNLFYIIYFRLNHCKTICITPLVLPFYDHQHKGSDNRGIFSVFDLSLNHPQKVLKVNLTIRAKAYLTTLSPSKDMVVSW